MARSNEEFFSQSQKRFAPLSGFSEEDEEPIWFRCNRPRLIHDVSFGPTACRPESEELRHKSQEEDEAIEDEDHMADKEPINNEPQVVHDGCDNIVVTLTNPQVFDHLRSAHQKACVYSPCSCPHLGCNYRSSAEKLYPQSSRAHEGSAATRFEYNRRLFVTLNLFDTLLVLHEKKDGTLFVLANYPMEDIGYAVMVTCVQSAFLEGFYYDLVAKSNGNSLILESFTKSIPRQQVLNDDSRPPKTGFLLIPSDFISSGRQLKMNLCIWA